MKRFSRSSILTVPVVALFFVSSCVTPPTRTCSSDCLCVGVAEVDITPTVPYRMAGYYDERISTGTHDHLKAKAFVFQQGDQKAAMVFCDLVQIMLPVSTKTRERVSVSCGIPYSNIGMFATHSHTGPIFCDVRGKYFNEDAIARLGHDPNQKIDYATFLIERASKAIELANKKLAPANLAVGIAQQEGLPFNRRYWLKNGRVAFNPGQLNPNVVKPAGPVDHDVGMLMVRDPKSGKNIGGLTVFAMHADCVGGTKWSADYPYFLQESLRRQFGSKYISAFGAGTCGDLNQINAFAKEDFKGFAAAERFGKMLGKTVVAAEPNLTPIKKASLAVRTKKWMAPLQETTDQEVAEARKNLPKLAGEELDFYSKVRMVKALDLNARGKEWPVEVQVFRLDNDTAIVGLPGEIFVELGLAIKKQSPFKNTLVIEIDNDRPCYMPTLKAFKEGSYEITNSRWKAGTGEQMVDAAVELLKELKP